MTAWFVYIERKLEIRMKINKDELNEELLNKLKKLETYIESLGSLAIGFSGGVDRTRFPGRKGEASWQYSKD